jgi:hypothetical protein
LPQGRFNDNTLAQQIAGVKQLMARGVNKAKMHHYVPRGYLARFTDDRGFLHVYDRRRRVRWRQKPDEVMKINKYYRQEWVPEGVDPNIMELTLGEWLETHAKDAIDRLVDAPTQLSEDDASYLLVYIELQRIRVPKQAARAKELMRELILRLAPPKAVKAITSGEFQLTMKDSARFEYMRMSTGMISPWFKRMNWEVIAAEDDASFITTDSPVSFYNPCFPPPEDAGIGRVGTEVFFPLSSRHVLLMRHPEKSKGSAASLMDVLPDPPRDDARIQITHGEVWNRKRVDNFNWILVQLSSDLIVSNSPEVLHRCTDCDPS